MIRLIDVSTARAMLKEGLHSEESSYGCDAQKNNCYNSTAKLNAFYESELCIESVAASVGQACKALQYIPIYRYFP